MLHVLLLVGLLSADLSPQEQAECALARFECAWCPAAPPGAAPESFRQELTRAVRRSYVTFPIALPCFGHLPQRTTAGVADSMSDSI